MNLNGKTIAVTGASGMIGVYLCRSLLKSGARVVGVVRNPAKADFLAKEGVEFRTADLNDQASLTEAFKGCDVVVSNAAMYVVTKSMHAWEAHEKANLEGTRNVFDAAAAAGVKRVVQISTFGIYKWSLLRTLDENSPQLNGAGRQGGPYRATKQTSEALAWELAQKHGIALTTVRPSAVFGARDNNFLQPIYQLLKLPVLPLPSINFPIVYAGDVANAVAGAIGNDASIGQAYNVCGDQRQFSDFIKALMAVVPKPRTVLALPLPVSIKVNNNKAQRDLGFINRPFEEALKEVVAEELPPKYLRG